LEHLLKVTVAERIAKISGDRLHDQSRLEISPFEIILDWRSSFSAMAFRIMATLYKLERELLRRSSTYR
jgi:hypothetical protein